MQEEVKMRKETSAGGVVMVGNAILLLRKYNGDWVLPKGRMKKTETLERTALREVCEESGVKGEILLYLGNIMYMLNSKNPRREKIEKTVHWFLMSAKNMECVPLRREGFIEAKYIPIEKAINIAKYDDERKILIKAAEYYEKNHNKGE